MKVWDCTRWKKKIHPQHIRWWGLSRAYCIWIDPLKATENRSAIKILQTNSQIFYIFYDFIVTSKYKRETNNNNKNDTSAECKSGLKSSGSLSIQHCYYHSRLKLMFSERKKKILESWLLHLLFFLCHWGFCNGTLRITSHCLSVRSIHLDQIASCLVNRFI